MTTPPAASSTGPPVTAVLGPRLHCGWAERQRPCKASCASPRSSDRGSIAATLTGSFRPWSPGSPRSSDRGSIAACRTRAGVGRGARVTAVLGPRLHCGGNTLCLLPTSRIRSPRSSDRGSIAAKPGWTLQAYHTRTSPRSSDRGSIAAARCRTSRPTPPTVTAVLGPRLHCGLKAGLPPDQYRRLVTAVLGPRLHCGGDQDAPPQPDRAVTAVLGPRLHCGIASGGTLADALGVTAVLGPRLHCGRAAERRSEPQRRVTAVLGPRLHCGAAAFDAARDADDVTAVLGPRLHCGGKDIWGPPAHSTRHRGPRTAAPLRRVEVRRVTLRATRSPRSSDRGSIAAGTAATGRSRRGARHRGPRTAAPLRPCPQRPMLMCMIRVTAVLGPRLHCGPSSVGSGSASLASSPRSSDRGSIAARTACRCPPR